MPDAISPMPWLERLLAARELQQLVERWRNQPAQAILGAQGSSTHLLAGLVAIKLKKTILLVTAHLDDADDAAEDLALFPKAGHELAIEHFGALEVLPGESNVNLELLAQRLALVEKLVHQPQWTQTCGVLIAPIQALMQCVPEPDALGEFSLTLKSRGNHPPGMLLDWLDRAGYGRADAIEQPGDFTVRGGIVDIFLPSAAGTGHAGPIAVRLDYFGDEIESIRRIDVETLGSAEPLEQIQIVGASMTRLQSEQRTVGFLSLLPPSMPVILAEPMELAEQARGYYQRLTQPRGIIEPNSLMKSLIERPHLEIGQLATSRDTPMRWPVAPLPIFDHDAGKAVGELVQLADSDQQVVVLCQNAAEQNRLGELISSLAPPSSASSIERLSGYLHRGFVWQPPDQSPWVLVPHHELFHRYQTRRRVRRVSAVAEKASDAFLDLDEGDYVVHVDHGIARFAGLKTLKRGSVTQDYLTLQFADQAVLHVPATQIDLVQRYVGGFEGRPPLSVLGGKRWAKQKEQAALAVKDLAAQMLRLQAARSTQAGIRYPKDSLWQNEFEAEFPYDETPDQLAAIAEIKKDMIDEQPMDRLICGDVGFGKTEVAMRAAFKAVDAGKQVAVLVPTTVLAEQHEITFRSRMAAYPIRIESVSRFKNESQQKQTLSDLANKKIDIIIGTHRLLSSDVNFADLGLVVVDEEQRFGVEHKQKLLQFRLTADVLTLSATPIPRTLHMAMLGLRDISSLSTPPADRRAVVTEVMPYEKRRIKHALERELAREGQVYFVHNRVHDIQSVADQIKQMVPSARIVIGHGQMSPHELEAVMLTFMHRRADILVSTTIIESGIDIPTANTIFIDQADIYGLADLHQLRGRVGRYKHRAYCYLLLPENRQVNEKAVKRLKAIEQYSMLGAGFKIAMRDLEIRGAGNLLGSEQSGHIAAVGYEMYCRLLEQEAKKLRNEKSIEPVKTHLELPAVGRLPNQYIPSSKLRMDAYRRLSRAAGFEEYDRIIRDLTDAYGQPTAPVQQFWDMAELRLAATVHEIDSIKLDGPDLIFRTKQPQKLDALLKNAPGRASLIDETTVYYRPPENYLQPIETLLAVLRKLLVRPLRPLS